MCKGEREREREREIEVILVLHAYMFRESGQRVKEGGFPVLALVVLRTASFGDFIAHEPNGTVDSVDIDISIQCAAVYC